MYILIIVAGECGSCSCYMYILYLWFCVYVFLNIVHYSSHSVLSMRSGFYTFLYELNFVYTGPLDRSLFKSLYKLLQYNTNFHLVFGFG
jgi:hypothetical protein